MKRLTPSKDEEEKLDYAIRLNRFLPSVPWREVMKRKRTPEQTRTEPLGALLLAAEKERSRAEAAEAEVARFREVLDAVEKEIDGDERYHYKPANIFSNGPLALIQTGMEAKMDLIQKLRAVRKEAK